MFAGDGGTPPGLSRALPVGRRALLGLHGVPPSLACGGDLDALAVTLGVQLRARDLLRLHGSVGQRLPKVPLGVGEWLCEGGL